MKRILVAITLCLIVAPLEMAVADDVSVSAALSTTVVPVGNEVELTIVIQGKFRKSGAPELPPLDDFYVYESGTSQNFNFINGAINSSITYRYNLVPRKEGIFKIEPIRVTLKDKQYTANPVTLEVVAAASAVVPPAGNQGRPGKTPEGSDKTGRQKDRSIFIRASTDRDTVFVNQQTTWTLGYYSDGRIDLLRSPNYTPPQAEGFWVEDLPPQNKYYTTLNGRQFLVNEIKRGYFPTSPGIFEIGEARVDLVVDDFNKRTRDDFFNRSFRSFGFGKSQTLMTEKKKIVVLPLPAAGRPADFTGVVAEDLLLSMSADKQVVLVGEPVNVTIELNGKGNIKTITPPPFEDVNSFKIYESGSSSDVFKKDYVVAGRKLSEFVVIPKVQGRLTIPAIRLPYFDPVKKRYLVAQSLPVQFDVKPGAKEEGRKIIYAGGGDDFEVISKDIRYIHPVPSVLAIAPRYIYQNKFYIAAHILPVFAVLFSFFAEGRRRKFSQNVGFARAARALKDADKKLNTGRKLFSKGRVEEGFSALSGAMDGYFADKMNVSPSGLTGVAIEEYLAARGVDSDTRSSLRHVFAACDQARYAATDVSADAAEETLDRARKALKTLERNYQG